MALAGRGGEERGRARSGWRLTWMANEEQNDKNLAQGSPEPGAGAVLLLRCRSLPRPTLAGLLHAAATYWRTFVFHGPWYGLLLWPQRVLLQLSGLTFSFSHMRSFAALVFHQAETSTGPNYIMSTHSKACLHSSATPSQTSTNKDKTEAIHKQRCNTAPFMLALSQNIPTSYTTPPAAMKINTHHF